jgi:DNA modification methylase
MELNTVFDRPAHELEHEVEGDILYDEFLKSKISLAENEGFEVTPDDLNRINTGYKKLKPHEVDAVIWAARGGRRALFESFGLGKTCQQLALMVLVAQRFQGKTLIIMPLGVKQEFHRDAVDFYGVEVEYVRTLQEAKDSTCRYHVTNYERVRDGDLDPNYYTAVSLDEASVLRGYGTKTYQTFLTLFDKVRFKFVATATPSPNKYKELIHYAGFLGIMDTGQALTRFFKRDSTKSNNLTLYPHKEEEFWLWVSTWALFITSPADLGYDPEGYELPPLDIRYHKIAVDHSTAGVEDNGQAKMFREAALSLRDAATEKRESIPARISKMMEIIRAEPDSHFILWHDLEAERHAIKKALPECEEIYGSLKARCDDPIYTLREKRTIDFSNGDIKYLATKPDLSGSGCNFQRYCHRAIFLGIDYKFNGFIQAIHRIYRFMQDKQVVIDIIYMESEEEILKVLLQKWQQHDYLVKKMVDIIHKFNLSHAAIEQKLTRTFFTEVEKMEKSRYIAVNADNVPVTRQMKSNSIDLIHTSIPFSNHYEYTPTYNDFGHNTDNDEFFKQMDFLTPELLRVLKPGRVAAIHVKDRILFGNATGDGMPTLDPFSDMTVFHFLQHGFRYMGRITVLTDVVRENNQTYRLGWSEQCKDGTKMGVGCPEYILLFRKLPTDTGRAYADTPVQKEKTEYTRGRWQIDANALYRSSGDRLLTMEELKNVPVDRLQAVYRRESRRSVYDYKDHVELSNFLNDNGRLPASFSVVAPGSWSNLVWDDINRMRTLNGNQASKMLQMHICPLQFDIVERIINRYSNKDEIVYDPFAGLFTVPYMAVKMGRYGVGCELNHDSYRDGLVYLQAASEMYEVPTLFDVVKAEEVDHAIS